MSADSAACKGVHLAVCAMEAAENDTTTYETTATQHDSHEEEQELGQGRESTTQRFGHTSDSNTPMRSTHRRRLASPRGDSRASETVRLAACGDHRPRHGSRERRHDDVRDFRHQKRLARGPAGAWARTRAYHRGDKTCVGQQNVGPRAKRLGRGRELASSELEEKHSAAARLDIAKPRLLEKPDICKRLQGTFSSISAKSDEQDYRNATWLARRTAIAWSSTRTHHEVGGTCVGQEYAGTRVERCRWV
jgi:hypothetical protein